MTDGREQDCGDTRQAEVPNRMGTTRKRMKKDLEPPGDWPDVPRHTADIVHRYQEMLERTSQVQLKLM